MWWSATDDDVTEVMLELEALAAQVAALSLAAVGEADRRGAGESAGAASTANWLSGKLRMRPEHASRMVKLARDLDGDLGSTAVALRAGQISFDHASVVARAVRDLPKEAGPQTRAEAEQALLAQAKTFDPKDLAKIGRKILDMVDPELADRLLAKQLADEEARQARARDLSLTDDPYRAGTWVRGWLDPITADMFRTALEPLAKPLPTTADGPDTRTYSQRLGDGFAEMIRRYLDGGASPSQGGEKPHLVITIDWERFRDGTGTGSLLRTGIPISARAAQMFGCDAKVSWYTPGSSGGDGSAGSSGCASRDGDGASWTGGGRGRDVGLSDAVRLFGGKARRLLELRDRGCAFPGCDRPPGWCHAHHVVAWSLGGPTTVDNGVLVCGTHHRLLHHSPWTVRIAADGHPEFTPPDYIDPRRQPLRNHRLRN